MTPTRASDAGIQDWHSHEAREAALRPLNASAGLESPDTYGVYLEWLGDCDDEGIRFHVPSLGSAVHVEEPEVQMRLIREVVAQAARALGLLEGVRANERAGRSHRPETDLDDVIEELSTDVRWHLEQVRKKGCPGRASKAMRDGDYLSAVDRTELRDLEGAFPSTGQIRPVQEAATAGVRR